MARKILILRNLNYIFTASVLEKKFSFLQFSISVLSFSISFHYLVPNYLVIQNQDHKMVGNNFNWFCLKKSHEKRNILEALLPHDYKYNVLQCDIDEKYQTEIFCEWKFKAKVRVNVCNYEALLEFLDSFKKVTLTQYNIRDRDNFKTNKFEATGFRKCVHNVRQQSQVEKRKGQHTDCPAKIKFQLEKHTHTENCEKMPLEFSIIYLHNHAILSSSAVKYHSVLPDTKARILELFQLGGSPSSVYAEYKRILEAENQENWQQVSADRSICPDYRYFFNLFAKFKINSFGRVNSPEAFQKSSKLIDDYNEKNKGLFAKIKQLDDGNFVAAVIDPLARRVHEVKILHHTFFLLNQNFLTKSNHLFDYSKTMNF